MSLCRKSSRALTFENLCRHLTTGIVVEALFNAFATAAFFKFMIFSIFEMRYLLIIWKARRPQGFQEGWNSMRRELSMLYSRFYGLIYSYLHMYIFWNFMRREDNCDVCVCVCVCIQAAFWPG